MPPKKTTPGGSKKKKVSGGQGAEAAGPAEPIPAASAAPATHAPARSLKRKANADEEVGAPSPSSEAHGAAAVSPPAHPRASAASVRAHNRNSGNADCAGQLVSRGTPLGPTSALAHAGAAGPMDTSAASGQALSLGGDAGRLFHQRLLELVELALRSRLMEFEWVHKRNDRNPAMGHSVATLRATSVTTMRVCGLEVSPFLGCSHLTPCPHRLEFAGFQYDDVAQQAYPVVHVYAEVVLEGVVVPSSRVYVNQHVVVRDQMTSTDGPDTQTYKPIAYETIKTRDVPSTLTHIATSSTDHFRGRIARVTSYRRPRFVPGLPFTELLTRFHNTSATAGSDDEDDGDSEVSEERTLAMGQPQIVTLMATHCSFQAPAAADAGGRQQGWRQLVTLTYTPLEGAEHAFAPQPWSDQPVEVGYHMALEVVAAGIVRDDAKLRDCPRYTISIGRPFPCAGLPRGLPDQKVRVPLNITVPGYTRIPGTDGEYFTRDSDYWSRYRPQNHTIHLPIIGSFRPSQYARSDGSIMHV